MSYHQGVNQPKASRGAATRPSAPTARKAARILVIEDDPEMSAEIVRCLTSGGFAAEPCFNGTDGLSLALSGRFDLVTLDRMLPGQDGLQIAQAVRGAGLDTPILMLSAVAELDERLQALRVGGDDYLIKPFEPSELVVRIQVLLRRSGRAQQPQQLLLRVGDLELDLVGREARRPGRTVELLPMEFKLLEFMMRNPGQMLSRRMIFEHVWEYYFDPGTNLIDVHVGKLRKKIDDADKPSFIRTERGVGYVLNAI